ncbi:MAG: CotH kinase family protein, partial [Clostridia bacterium]|nr:CotH kinase family protein [Clostridia bacterium]
MMKRSNRLFWTAAILILLTVLSCMLYGCEQSVPADAATIPDTETALAYRVCRTGGGRIEGWNTQHGLPGDTAAQSVTAVPKLGYVFTGWSDGVTDATRTDVFGTEDRTITANFSFDRKNLPIISIWTDTGSDVTSKDTYIGATVSVCNTGNAAWEISGAAAEIKGRGNGTWTYNKKSYRLHFAQKHNLLGLGADEDRTWILMANHADRSMLRNYLAIDLINRIPEMGYNNNGVHVEVYLNGAYHGVYLLAEQIQVDAHRVDIGLDTLEDPEAEDAGFLVEMDEYASEETNYFYVEGKAYLIKSDVHNDAQFAYIKNYIAEVDHAIREGDREALEALVDLDSFVNGYIVEEFFKNLDAGWSSFYMYKKPGEKMVFGPFWDFDLSAGNNISLDNGAPEGIYVGRELGFSQRHVWYTQI